MFVSRRTYTIRSGSIFTAARSAALAAPGRILQTREDAFDRPLFVLTADVDWASDHCIDALATFAHERGVIPTLFVTHDSPAIAALRGQESIECGIHPNFLPGSSHGADPGEVIAHMLAIVPKPIASRNHRYAETSEIAGKLAAAGLRVDSNVCLFLQPGLRPLYLWSGVMRLPCFWEDDVHWERGFDWDFARLRKMFFRPGLKILSVHPFMFALNIPDAVFYARQKQHIPTLDAASARQLRFQGNGPATFLAELIDAVRQEGLAFTTMSALIDDLGMEWVEP
jgi:hypothetical protein